MSDRELIERARFTHEHGVFDAVEAGKYVDLAQLADRLQALSAEVEMYREALKPFVDGYSHTAVFLSSREKMHSCGRELYAQDVERARQALKGANNG